MADKSILCLFACVDCCYFFICIISCKNKSSAQSRSSSLFFDYDNYLGGMWSFF